MVPTLHGGGREFESPRLHFETLRFAGTARIKTRLTDYRPSPRAATWRGGSEDSCSEARWFLSSKLAREHCDLRVRSTSYSLLSVTDAGSVSPGMHPSPAALHYPSIAGETLKSR